jgi:hypothetical protein
MNRGCRGSFGRHKLGGGHEVMKSENLHELDWNEARQMPRS